jgi:hypothetical protein
MCTQSANEDSFISLGLYYCISVLPEPKVRLVGGMEMSHTAAHSDEKFTCLMDLPSRLSLLRHRNVQEACAHFGLEAAVRGFCSYWERVKENTIYSALPEV